MPIMLFKAVNYAMGRPMAELRFEARSYEAAKAIAEAKLKGAHARTEGRPTRVLGIRAL